jgi:hypothetical protein
MQAPEALKLPWKTSLTATANQETDMTFTLTIHFYSGAKAVLNGLSEQEVGRITQTITTPSNGVNYCSYREE